MFKKAERKKSKLRLALTGPSGSGKTFSSLILASSIGRNIAVIDTEHGSASLYSNQFDFDVLEMQAPFSPEAYITGIQAAESAGYDTLVIDSITHEWNGAGGCLEIVDKIAQAKSRGNSFTAWAEVTPRHNRFIEAILQSKMHVIVTMRSKQDFVITDKNGKSVPQKVGLAPIQRDGMEYEFTTVLDLSLNNYAQVSKDRTQIFDKDPFIIEKTHGEQLMDWLNQGIDSEAISLQSFEKFKKDLDAIKVKKHLKNWMDKHAPEINQLLPRHIEALRTICLQLLEQLPETEKQFSTSLLDINLEAASLKQLQAVYPIWEKVYVDNEHYEKIQDYQEREKAKKLFHRAEHNLPYISELIQKKQQEAA